MKCRTLVVTVVARKMHNVEFEGREVDLVAKLSRKLEERAVVLGVDFF